MTAARSRPRLEPPPFPWRRDDAADVNHPAGDDDVEKLSSHARIREALFNSCLELPIVRRRTATGSTCDQAMQESGAADDIDEPVAAHDRYPFDAVPSEEFGDLFE